MQQIDFPARLDLDSLKKFVYFIIWLPVYLS